MIQLDGTSGFAEFRGKALGVSSWLELSQSDVDDFARVTGDDAWIHVDPARAASSPFGGTIVHGALTLSLVPRIMMELLEVEGFAYGVNYGLDRVRFPSPFPVGAPVRATLTLADAEIMPDGVLATYDFVFERRGGTKPVCVARWLSRYFSTEEP